MIGGCDIIIPTTLGPEALAKAVAIILRAWPSAVVEDVELATALPASADFSACSELLAFRDQQSADLWEALGADASLDSTLIQLLFINGTLTLTVDERPSPEIERIVGSIRREVCGGDIAKTTARSIFR